MSERQQTARSLAMQATMLKEMSKWPVENWWPFDDEDVEALQLRMKQMARDLRLRAAAIERQEG